METSRTVSFVVINHPRLPSLDCCWSFKDLLCHYNSCSVPTRYELKLRREVKFSFTNNVHLFSSVCQCWWRPSRISWRSWTVWCRPQYGMSWPDSERSARIRLSPTAFSFALPPIAAFKIARFFVSLAGLIVWLLGPLFLLTDFTDEKCSASGASHCSQRFRLFCCCYSRSLSWLLHAAINMTKSYCSFTCARNWCVMYWGF